MRASWSWINECRLAPPESVRTGRTRSWRIWMRKRSFLGSERKRRLLHNFIVQKMIPECTIFAYGSRSAFLEKSTETGSQFRPAHSYLWRESGQKVTFVPKVTILTPSGRSDEWAGLNLTRRTRENTRKQRKVTKVVLGSSHPVVPFARKLAKDDFPHLLTKRHYRVRGKDTRKHGKHEKTRE